MILARSARRAFILEGELPEQSLRFLRALPDMPDHTALDPHVIRVHARPDGLVDAWCSWGRSFTGSARALTRILDEDVLRLALADAGLAPILAATVVRHGETRLALIGTDETTRTRLTIALIAAGAAFEGDGFAIMGPDGLQPHPRKPRLTHGTIGPTREACGLPDGTVDLPIARDATCSMVDPTFGGQPWHVVRGAAQHFVFLDGNDQGRAGLAPIAMAEALSRTMRRIHVPVTSVAGLALIQKTLSGARFSRLTLGPTSEVAATLMRALGPADRPPHSANASHR